jgi:hypothetical protein
MLANYDESGETIAFFNEEMQGDDIQEGVGFINGRLPPPLLRGLTLQSTIKSQMINLQFEMDFLKTLVS